MPGSQFWSLLWFSMLFCLGIDSMFGTIEGLITPLYDIGVSKRIKHFYVICIVIFISFLVSLTFVQGSGSYWLDVFDTYAGGLPLLIIAFFELIAVGWVFKYKNYEKEICDMIGERKHWFRKALGYYWWAMIPIISPILLLAVFIGYLYEKLSTPNTYSAWIEEEGANVTKEYPPVAVAVSTILALACTIWIPLVAGYKAIQYYRGRSPADNYYPESGNSGVETVAENVENGVPSYETPKSTKHHEQAHSSGAKSTAEPSNGTHANEGFEMDAIDPASEADDAASHASST